MRLFDFNRAPNPRRVRMFIAEKGLQIEQVPVNLFRMEQLSPEFLKINPLGTVPVLETDDGTYLTQSTAIAQYLEALNPEPQLMGNSALNKALVINWTTVVEQNGMFAVAEMLRNWSPGFRNHVFPGQQEYAQIPELIERGRQRTEQFFDTIETRLAETNYLAGTDFSWADISLLVTTDFAGWVEIVPQQSRPALADWYARVASRPSAGA